MPAIPPFILKKLYVKNSLQPKEDGFVLSIHNVIAPGTILGFRGLELDGQPVSLDQVTIEPDEGESRPAKEITAEEPLSFPKGATFSLRVHDVPLTEGAHTLKLHVLVDDIGPVEIPVRDNVG